MLLLDDFLHKSYYDLMIEIDSYNKTHNKNIHIIVSKINNNIKFYKFIDMNDYYYINLYTDDIEICNELEKILELEERIYLTRKYFIYLISNVENCKKIFISKIF